MSSSAVGLIAVGLSKLCQTKIVAVYFPGFSGIHDTAGEKDCPWVNVPVIHDNECTVFAESLI